MRSSKYDETLLTPIVATSHSLAETIRRLGLPASGGNYRYISARIRNANLDTSHFRSRLMTSRIKALSREELAPHVSASTSVAQVLIRLGLPTKGRPNRDLSARLEELELDMAHFRGMGWARGHTRTSHPAIERMRIRIARPDAEVFIENSPETNGVRIARRLVGLGWHYRCSICGIAEWQGHALVLHLDHINGINNDNRQSNLRLLCPNCHSQTPTYCRRGR